MKKIKHIFWLLQILIVLISGCSRQHYGNYSDLSSEQTTVMATSTVSRLSTLYPPALTQISMKTAAKDFFGQSLVNQLRDRGYSVQEFSEKKRDHKAEISSTDGPKSSNSIDLSYIVDNPGIQNFYRVTINVGDQSISRGFVVDNSGKITSAGAWVRKE